MQLIADLHVHSRYSRATSRDLSLRGLYLAAQRKGVDLIGTGDFTHPKYLSEISEQLVPNEAKFGFFSLKKQNAVGAADPVFILTGEVACIYSLSGKTYRNHLLLAAPDLEAVKRIVAELGARGNLSADGRPILGLSAEELTKIVLAASPESLVIPAHIWTPWFSTFGSKSGFDSWRECFGKMADQILAVETGLSSDPPMNWQIKELDNLAIISNGDAHSAPKVAREATVYELGKPTYHNLVQALKNSARLDKKNLPADYIKYTIEFYPEEGKYHWDGHRDCGVRLSPEESRRARDICPKCRKPLTLGVLHRVNQLATRTPKEAEDYARSWRLGFKKIVPLVEVIADTVGQKPGTKKVNALYEELIVAGGNELNVLLNLSKSDLSAMTRPEVVDAITRMRAGQLQINPGYDGEFGEVKIFTDAERAKLTGAQALLF